MRLIEVTHAEAWDVAVAAAPYAQFAQSWAWGEFRRAQGCQIRRYALVDGETWRAAIQMEYRARRFGVGYWFAPRGPVFLFTRTHAERRIAMMTLCEELLNVRDLRRHTLFWRFEPSSELSNPEGLVPLSFQRTHAQNPASTILMDLTLSQDDLIQTMHEKTRYNIRLAARRDVTVRVGSGAKDVDSFLCLMEETARRDRFISHPLSYLAATYYALAVHGMATIRIAEHSGTALAAQMEIAYGDTVTYLYGASSSNSRELMAPYALQWEAICEAKSKGYSTYDFWGANPEFCGSFYFKPAWQGITRFKRGFGGRPFDFVGTWDLPFYRTAYALMHMDLFFRG